MARSSEAILRGSVQASRLGAAFDGAGAGAALKRGRRGSKMDVNM
jgi:hypothetical protein